MDALSTLAFAVLLLLTLDVAAMRLGTNSRDRR